MSITQLRHIVSGPLLIEPRFGALLASLLARKLAGASFSGAELHAELQIAMPDAKTGSGGGSDAARIAVIPIRGVIAQHPNSLGSSTSRIGEAVDAAVASRNIDAILYPVDSPGGGVSDVPETAAKIAAAAKVKPSLAIADSLAASAAYWLAAAAGQFWIKPSGQAGSIGVYTIHKDLSAAMEKEGVKITLISAGKFKMEGAPWAPLTEEAQANLQAQVDQVYGWIVKDVAAFRKDTQANVRAGYGEGRLLLAEDAVKANLVDKIGTMDEAIARLEHQVGSSRKTRASIERDRVALDAARM